MDRNWFEVDRNGLKALVERRGKAFVLFELISNAWDTEAKVITVKFEPVPDQKKSYLLSIEDDHPDGFKNLEHAYTVFAESEKKTEATKRGRFNLGEKLVLALCSRASISSTRGTVLFDKNGRRQSSARRISGSVFEAVIHMTQDEYKEALAAVQTLLRPEDKQTTINGKPLPFRRPLEVFEATLPTEIADEAGIPRRTARKTLVSVYEPAKGEVASIYELGIPIVETGDRWHINISQKVPLSMERDNVTPAYLRQVRTLVLNHMHDRLDGNDVNTTWVRDAASGKDCSTEATASVVNMRYGDKRVAFDPSDPEANKIAVSKGYTVVHGRMMSATEWENVRKAGVILPAGQVTPSPKPFDPDGRDANLIPEEKWTEAERTVVDYAKLLAQLLMGAEIDVAIASEAKWPYHATYGRRGNGGRLTFNKGTLGEKFFAPGVSAEINSLLLHEFAHHFSSDHLSSEFHDAVCDLGGKLAELWHARGVLLCKFRLKI